MAFLFGFSWTVEKWISVQVTLTTEKKYFLFHRFLNCSGFAVFHASQEENLRFIEL